MTHIVKRLRVTDPEAEALGVPELERRMWEAADEIERLLLEATALHEKYYRLDDKMNNIKNTISEAFDWSL